MYLIFEECLKVAVFEMFMASTFRPGDAVCVHIDQKADDKIVLVMFTIENILQI